MLFTNIIAKFVLLVGLAVTITQGEIIRDELDQLVQEDALIHVNTDGFNRYVVGSRDYDLLALFTVGWVDCMKCGGEQAKIGGLADAYFKKYHGTNRKMYFIVLDVHSSKPLFEKMNIIALPTLVYFDRNALHPNPRIDYLNILRYPRRFNSFITEKLGEKLSYKPRTFWPDLLVSYGPWLALFGGLWVNVSLDEIIALIRGMGRQAVMIIACVVSLYYTSGMAWNSIRGE
eukprot:Ihof_evm13s54 gene=Ihof_evmTU13s54